MIVTLCFGDGFLSTVCDLVNPESDLRCGDWIGGILGFASFNLGC